ncbi:MAG: zinc-dependent alcohol dehydrogenase [Promethearchaeota archaeon]|jgi:threonine dehydrogenase-like Zn-dependent dehydrogenase
MKAAVYHGPRDIRTEEVEDPNILDDQILINVKACGICGSDLHLYKWDLYAEGLIRPLEKGGIPGHEFSGVVEKVGSKVSGINEGDRVVAITYGGMAEYVPVTVNPGFNVFQLPSEVTFEEAATLEPLSNSYHAMMKGNPAKGENTVIFGAGTIGLGIIQCLKAFDVDTNKNIVIDFSDYRLNIAKQLGADGVINIGKQDPYEEIVRFVGSSPLLRNPEVTIPNVDIIYDCVGYMKEFEDSIALQQAFNLIRPSTGRIVVHGLFEDKVSLDLLLMVWKQIAILGSFAFTPEEVEKCLELLRTKKIDQSKIITHKFPLDKAKEAFETQCNIEESIKVLIKP